MGTAKQRKFTLDDIKARIEANPALKAANPGLWLSHESPVAVPNGPAVTLGASSGSPDTQKAKKKGKKRKEMNATEREFTLILDRRVNSGEFHEYSYESITLRWGEGKSMLAYTPDFTCVEVVADFGRIGGQCTKITFIETKGGHIFAKDLVKFKAAKTHFGHLFGFEMWQKKDRQWTQLI